MENIIKKNMFLSLSLDAKLEIIYVSNF